MHGNIVIHVGKFFGQVAVSSPQNAVVAQRDTTDQHAGRRFHDRVFLIGIDNDESLVCSQPYLTVLEEQRLDDCLTKRIEHLVKVGESLTGFPSVELFTLIIGKPGNARCICIGEQRIREGLGIFGLDHGHLTIDRN